MTDDDPQKALAHPVDANVGAKLNAAVFPQVMDLCIAIGYLARLLSFNPPPTPAEVEDEFARPIRDLSEDASTQAQEGARCILRRVLEFPMEQDPDRPRRARAVRFNASIEPLSHS